MRNTRASRITTNRPARPTPRGKYWMWIKGVCLLRRLAEWEADGDRSCAGQRRDNLVGVGLELFGALERAARRAQCDACPTRQKVKMQVEDLLAACGLVELLEQKPLRLHARHDGASDLLHRGR